MFETIKTVNGYEVKRMVGSRGHYTVSIWETHNGFGEFHTFRTIKAACAFCESMPERSEYIRQHPGRA